MMYRGLIYASTLGVFGWNYHFLPEYLPSPWGMGVLSGIVLMVLLITGGGMWNGCRWGGYACHEPSLNAAPSAS
jgi:hypothetical protein